MMRFATPHPFDGALTIPCDSIHGIQNDGGGPLVLLCDRTFLDSEADAALGFFTGNPDLVTTDKWEVVIRKVGSYDADALRLAAKLAALQVAINREADKDPDAMESHRESLNTGDVYAAGMYDGARGFAVMLKALLEKEVA